MSKDPAAPYARFHGNPGSRIIELTNSAEAIRMQLVERYLYMYGMAPDTRGFSHLKIIILAAYAVSLVGMLSTRAIR